MLPQLDVLYFVQGHGRPSLSGEGVGGKGSRRDLQGRGREWRKEGKGNWLICKINFKNFKIKFKKGRSSRPALAT